MFFRSLLIAGLTIGLSTTTLAGQLNIQRYRIVDALHNQIMTEYHRLPDDTTNAATKYRLGLLDEALKSELFRQLATMSDSEIRMVIPMDAPILKMSSAERREFCSGFQTSSINMLELAVLERRFGQSIWPYSIFSSPQATSTPKR